MIILTIWQGQQIVHYETDYDDVPAAEADAARECQVDNRVTIEVIDQPNQLDHVIVYDRGQRQGWLARFHTGNVRGFHVTRQRWLRSATGCPFDLSGTFAEDWLAARVPVLG